MEKCKPITHQRYVQFALLFLIGIFSAFLSSCKSEGAGILGKQTTLGIDENLDIKNAPFAYDMAVDTISYNSCVIAPGASAGNIHGIKMGSSEGFVDNLGTGAVKGGIKLRSDFLRHVGREFTPDYPSNTVTPSQIVRILNTSYSIQNANANLIFAVRKKSDYTAVPDLIQYTTNTATPVSPGIDAVAFPYNLASGYLGYSITKGIRFNPDGSILAEGPRSYNLSDSTDAIPIEGTFAFNATVDGSFNTAATGVVKEPFGKAEIYSQQVRDTFNTNTQLLTATFGHTGATTGNPVDDAIGDTINNIKRPYNSAGTAFDQTKAFGRGYNLKFESQTTVTTWPKNRLTLINEIDLDTGTPTGATSWSCEQYAIAPASLWNNNKPKNPLWVNDSIQVEPNCAPVMATDITCTGLDTTAQCNFKKDRAEKIKRIRRHYSTEAWNIGVLFPAANRNGYTPPDRRTLSLCVSPKTGSCYLPTAGILDSDATNTIDVGIQFDRAQDCYLTSATISGSRDTLRKKGRCAQYASICVRNSSNY